MSYRDVDAVRQISDAYGADFYAMHQAWRAEYEALADVLAARIQFSSIIDLGCGNGYIIARLAELGKDIAGVEGSTNALAYMPEVIRARVRIEDITCSIQPD